MKKILIVGLLPVILVAVFFMQNANALIPRMDFSDNHYTYISPGGPKICGSHICKPGEWDQWKKQLMLSQLKKSGTIINKNSVQDKTNPVLYGGSQSAGTADAKITRVDTINMGNGDYVSFVTVSASENPIRHIEISQTNSNIDVKKAWVNPLWDVKITGNTVVFDSSKMYVLPSNSVGIVIVTDDKTPVFNLNSAA